MLAGQKCLIDEEDVELLTHFKWHITGHYLASKKGYGRKNKRDFYLHRFLMSPPKNMSIDHILE